jgi:predicted ester cyclase
MGRCSTISHSKSSARVADDHRVATRWVLTGSTRGRHVRQWGITLSHLRERRIAEDWSGFDSIELLRQLGLMRTLLAAHQ